MSHASRTLRVLTTSAAAGALFLAAPLAAPAKPAVSELRVEAGGQALAPGHRYVTNTVRLRTDTTPACGGTGKPVTVKGPTAVGLVDHARRVEPALRPYRVSDKFDFGLLVCGIGEFVGSDTAFWLYKVDHVSPEVGGDQFALDDGDEVLWYFQDTERGINTGEELELRAPARARPGEPFTVTAFRYDAAGKRRRAAGAEIAGGQNVATTDAKGRATLGAGDAGTLTLRATRGPAIASEPIDVCVNEVLGQCPAVRGERILGRSGADSITGTPGADEVRARGGDDTIDVTGNERDRVLCGAGDDTVRADRRDRVARDCETVRRPTRSAAGG